MPPIDEARVGKLFAALALEYGGRWAGQWAGGETLRLGKAAWWAQIAGLTDAQIKHALDTMPVGPDAWPPGPRAFRKLALGGELRREGAHVLLLPEPPPTPAQREAARAALAAALQGLGVAGDGGAGAEIGKRRRVRRSAEERRAFVARHRAELEALIGAAGVGAELGEG